MTFLLIYHDLLMPICEVEECVKTRRRKYSKDEGKTRLRSRSRTEMTGGEGAEQWAEGKKEEVTEWLLYTLIKRPPFSRSTGVR